ncbi:MAG: hypothetical protein R3B70_39795 [Polyangiaceae bacterium]
MPGRPAGLGLLRDGAGAGAGLQGHGEIEGEAGGRAGAGFGLRAGVFEDGGGGAELAGDLVALVAFGEGGLRLVGEVGVAAEEIRDAREELGGAARGGDGGLRGLLGGGEELLGVGVGLAGGDELRLRDEVEVEESAVHLELLRLRADDAGGGRALAGGAERVGERLAGVAGLACGLVGLGGDLDDLAEEGVERLGAGGEGLAALDLRARRSAAARREERCEGKNAEELRQEPHFNTAPHSS